MKHEVMRARKIVLPVVARTFEMSRRSHLAASVAVAIVTIALWSLVPSLWGACVALIGVSVYLLTSWTVSFARSWRKAESGLREEARAEAQEAVRTLQKWEEERKREEVESWEREYGVVPKEDLTEKLLSTMRERMEASREKKSEQAPTHVSYYSNLTRRLNENRPPKFPLSAMFFGASVMLFPKLIDVAVGFANRGLDSFNSSLPPAVAGHTPMIAFALSEPIFITMGMSIIVISTLAWVYRLIVTPLRP